MGASQRHKCEIHNFTVIGDGSCPPYSQGASGQPGPGPGESDIVWNRPQVPDLQVDQPMDPINMNDFIRAGSQPIRFMVPPTDQLPAGLTLSPAGILSGTPTATGSTGLVVRATNSTGMEPSPGFRIRVV